MPKTGTVRETVHVNARVRARCKIRTHSCNYYDHSRFKYRIKKNMTVSFRVTFAFYSPCIIFFIFIFLKAQQYDKKFLYIYVISLCMFILIPLLIVIQVGFAGRVLILMEQVIFHSFKLNDSFVDVRIALAIIIVS